jgi:asparaginyl-tRNA synthetase
MDLQSEHEKYLCEYFDKPVFVTNYPREIKAFYMKNNPDGKTVACFDLLFSMVGELIGGSEREDNHKILESKMSEKKMYDDESKSYLDLRKFGHGKTAGFGLGYERLLMFVTGTKNIKDTIAYPRYYKS